MNVLQFFEATLGDFNADEEQNWKEIPLDSPCGLDCKQAILAADMMVTCIRKAHGKHGDAQVLDVIDMAIEICNVFING